MSSFILRWNLNREPNPRGRRRRRERFPLAYRLLIPIALVEGVFVLYPILQGILMSVQFTQGGITSFVAISVHIGRLRHGPNDRIAWSAAHRPPDGYG